MKYKELTKNEQMLAFSIVEGNTFKFQLDDTTDDPLQKIPKDENLYNYLLKYVGTMYILNLEILINMI